MTWRAKSLLFYSLLYVWYFYLIRFFPQHFFPAILVCYTDFRYIWHDKSHNYPEITTKIQSSYVHFLMSYGCTDRQTDMRNKLKRLRTEDGWYLPHFTYQHCGIFPTLHTGVVASFPSYLTALWPTPLLASMCLQDSSDQYTYQIAAEGWVVRQLLDGQTVCLPSRSAQKLTVARLCVHPEKPDWTFRRPGAP